MKPRVYTVFSTKGGTGKTATAAALAQAFALDGKKALAIDLDPQANLSFCLAADLNAPGALEMLQGDAPNVQHSPQGLDVISANSSLSSVRAYKGSALRLQAALEPLQSLYDFIVIDTPPALGESALNALQASQAVLCTLEADASSLQGLYYTAEIVRELKASSNPDLTIAGTVLTRYNPRTRFSAEMLEQIRTAGKELSAPLLGTVRQGIAVREAAGLQRSLFEYAPKSNPAQDYLALYHALTGGRKK